MSTVTVRDCKPDKKQLILKLLIKTIWYKTWVNKIWSLWSTKEHQQSIASAVAVEEKQIIKIFNAPNINSTLIQMNKLKSKLSYVSWPGLSGNLIICLYLILFICAFDKDKNNVNNTNINSIFPIDQIRDLLILYVFKRPRNAIFALQLIFGSHCLEAIYVWALLYKFKFSYLSKCSWILLDILLGYPITIRAMKLNQLLIAYESENKKSNKNSELELDKDL